ILRQKRLSEVQKDFINNVSHELKTPLATLSLASETLKERSGDKENKYVQVIQKEVGRLQKNVEDILHSSLLESHLKVEKAPVQIMEFLQDIVTEVKEEYSGEMIEWSLSGTADRSILSNKKFLENCVRNLVDNSVKYGGKHISIHVDQSSKSTTISVSDNGQGIPKKHQKKIFKKFYRVPESSHQHNQKGFGLGLHIVASEIKKLGGKISVDSTEGVGSTFKITLPNG
ncbi:MAG: HAMP domain-containing sensor histidine kinase, partial [Ekhidna sp.]